MHRLSPAFVVNSACQIYTIYCALHIKDNDILAAKWQKPRGAVKLKKEKIWIDQTSRGIKLLKD